LEKLAEQWERFRLAMARVDAIPQMGLVGIFTGLFTALVIIAFRLIIEAIQSWLLPDGAVENYEGLPVYYRLAFPVVGALIIAGIWRLVSQESRAVGVVHVLERVAYNQAFLPAKNFLMQFVGAAIAIISGQSVGREGPGIHLGAASGSLLGQYLQLPNNTLRVLVACGVAAAIAASFNTPIAGVIFAMEVIVLEYSAAGFTPIILSAVTATVVTRAVFGDVPAFPVPHQFNAMSLLELPGLVAMSLLIGATAAYFNHLLIATTKLSASYSLTWRLTGAGLITGAVAIFQPGIMGIGYDSVTSCLNGEMGLLALMLLFVAKWAVTACTIGLGMPAGLIGPTFVMGASLGAAAAIILAAFSPFSVQEAGYYSMLGMAAMMAAVLQAPLAALMALLELTLTTHIILPGMLAVVVASMSARHLFSSDGVFRLLLQARGLDYAHHPVTQSLRRAGVLSVIDRAFVQLPADADQDQIKEALQKKPQWIIYWDDENNQFSCLRAAAAAVVVMKEDGGAVSLKTMPAERKPCVIVGHKATLQEALDKMLESDSELVCVIRQRKKQALSDTRVLGVVTKSMIDAYYQYP